MLSSVRNAIYRKLWSRYFFDHGIVTPAGNRRVFDSRQNDHHSADTAYMIYRVNGGSGFFSNVIHVFRHLQVAEAHHMIPVVDFFYHPTIYSLDGLQEYQDGWGAYFEPVSELSIDEAYRSSNLVFCTGEYPAGYPDCYEKDDASVLACFKSRIRVKTGILDDIQHVNDKLAIEGKATIGVHWRGNEQNRAAGHWFGATEDQIFSSVDRLLETGHYDQVFLSTESLWNFKRFITRYGSRVVFTEYLRSDGNVYKTKLREGHYFKLGKEILTDAMLLSSCSALVSADSNVSDFAEFYSNGRYRDRIFIDNGMNRPGLMSLYRYPYAKYLPASLGGLKRNVIHYSNTANRNDIS